MRENYFKNRRSCRQFTKETIDNKKIEYIIQQASKAPTCGNMQLYSVVVTHEEENKKKLSGYHYNQPASATADVILTVCADFNRFTKWCEIYKADAGYDNFHSFITAMTDAVIFAQQIVTVAELNGLGTCYLGTVTYNAKEISKLLHLPELVVPVVSIALGSIKEPGEKTSRLPLNGFLHYETYTSHSNNEIIDIYKIHDDDPENDKFLKENHKENLAKVFAEVRYPREVNEKLSDKFIKLLKEKGFMKN